ncbi:MAG: hypothetical protein GX417_04480 [Clostridiales bacterium]|nr:hypothetical protein [Clostridiales bacterium]
MTEQELFKEAVMQYLVDDAQVKSMSKRRKSHPVARRILFAAACLLVAVSVTIFAIPSARAAVEEWISGWFSAQDYFGQEAAERTKEPTIEAIITSADGNSAQVIEVGPGYEAYADAFEMTLDEIAYDGETIFLSGTMSGATARPFVQAYTGGDTFRAEKNDGSLGGDPNQEYYFFECESLVQLKIGDGEYIGNISPAITDDMNPILFAGAAETKPVFENGALITTNSVTDALWDTYLADHTVRFSIELLKMYTYMQPLTGIVPGDLSLKLFYGNVEGKDAIQVLNASFGGIAIDANAYQEQTQTKLAKTDTSVTLGGMHTVTVEAWQPVAERTSDDCEFYLSTRDLDFTGASISLKSVTFTPTDVHITLHIILPESWSKEERVAAIQEFHFLLDGKELPKNLSYLFATKGPMGLDFATFDYQEMDYELFDSVLSPSEWAKVKTLTIIPTTQYWWDMMLWDGNDYQIPFSLQNGAVYTGIANHGGYQCDVLCDEMTEYTLIINLDDYR